MSEETSADCTPIPRSLDHEGPNHLLHFGIFFSVFAICVALIISMAFHSFETDFSRKSSKKTSTLNSQIRTVTQSNPSENTHSTNINNISDWETYSDPKIMISLSYPKGSAPKGKYNTVSFYDKARHPEFPWMSISVENLYYMSPSDAEPLTYIERKSDIATLLTSPQYDSILWEKSGNWYISSSTISTFGPQWYAFTFDNKKMVQISLLGNKEEILQVAKSVKHIPLDVYTHDAVFKPIDDFVRLSECEVLYSKWTQSQSSHVPGVFKVKHPEYFVHIADYGGGNFTINHNNEIYRVTTFIGNDSSKEIIGNNLKVRSRYKGGGYRFTAKDSWDFYRGDYDYVLVHIDQRLTDVIISEEGSHAIWGFHVDDYSKEKSSQHFDDFIKSADFKCFIRSVKLTGQDASGGIPSESF